MARKVSKPTIKRKLDKITREWCRSLGRCEAQGYNGLCTPQLQWCHIKSRKYLSIRWSKNNCFCLCASHHRWFHDNPDDFKTFIDERYPEKHQALLEEFKIVNPMKVWQMEELYDTLKEEYKDSRV